MIIDVIDLNFKDLQFNKRYDMSRYNRGRGIYNNRYVEVTKVEKIDDENYDVEASVDGYYDTYTTTLKIYRSLIRKCSCTCEDYRKGNLCKHIIATSMEVIEPHCASTNEGRIKLEEKRQEEERKRLEELKRRQEEQRKKQEIV